VLLPQSLRSPAPPPGAESFAVAALPTSEGELARIRDLIRDGKTKEAELLLDVRLAGGGADFETRAMHVRLLSQTGRGGDAIAAAQDALKARPQDVRAHILLGQQLLQLDAPREALGHLAAAREAVPKKPGLQSLHAQAALMTGDLDAALDSIGRALALDPANADFRLRRAVLLAAAGRMEEADEIRRDVEDGARGMLGIYRDWIFALNRADRGELALKLSDDACLLAPAQSAPWIWRAEVMLGLGRPDDVLLALDRSMRANEPMSEAEAFRFARARTRALSMRREHAAAIEACKQALALRPEDQTTLRDLYVLHLQTDQDEAMREYGRMLERAGAKKLPATLALGLSELKGRKPPPSLMNARTRWAWEIADKSKWSEAAWLESLHWGHNADELMRAWWLNAWERSGEIGALIDRTPDNTVDRLLPRGERCLCVTTHMGPLAASVYHLQTCGRPYRGFGFAGPDPVVDGEPPMRISARGNSSLRKLMAEIAKGTLIGFAAESPDTHHSIALDFLGRRISLSTMVPRLIWKLKTRSMWWHTLWKGDRIALELEMLPDPEDGEALEPWCRRWIDAYLARVARIMQSDPRNLTLRHGIWRNLEE